jgi:hypothetical protein
MQEYKTIKRGEFFMMPDNDGSVFKKLSRGEGGKFVSVKKGWEFAMPGYCMVIKCDSNGVRVSTEIDTSSTNH